eukprot:g1362.t1
MKYGGVNATYGIFICDANYGVLVGSRNMTLLEGRNATYNVSLLSDVKSGCKVRIDVKARFQSENKGAEFEQLTNDVFAQCRRRTEFPVLIEATEGATIVFKPGELSQSVTVHAVEDDLDLGEQNWFALEHTFANSCDERYTDDSLLASQNVLVNISGNDQAGVYVENSRKAVLGEMDLRVSTSYHKPIDKTSWRIRLRTQPTSVVHVNGVADDCQAVVQHIASYNLTHTDAEVKDYRALFQGCFGDDGQPVLPNADVEISNAHELNFDLCDWNEAKNVTLSVVDDIDMEVCTSLEAKMNFTTTSADLAYNSKLSSVEYSRTDQTFDTITVVDDNIARVPRCPINPKAVHHNSASGCEGRLVLEWEYKPFTLIDQLEASRDQTFSHEVEYLLAIDIRPVNPLAAEWRLKHGEDCVAGCKPETQKCHCTQWEEQPVYGGGFEPVQFDVSTFKEWAYILKQGEWCDDTKCSYNKFACDWQDDKKGLRSMFNNYRSYEDFDRLTERLVFSITTRDRSVTFGKGRMLTSPPAYVAVNLRPPLLALHTKPLGKRSLIDASSGFDVGAAIESAQILAPDELALVQGVSNGSLELPVALNVQPETDTEVEVCVVVDARFASTMECEASCGCTATGSGCDCGDVCDAGSVARVLQVRTDTADGGIMVDPAGMFRCDGVFTAQLPSPKFFCLREIHSRTMGCKQNALPGRTAVTLELANTEFHD